MQATPSVLAFVLTIGLIGHARAASLSAQESVVAPGTRIRFKLRNGERYDARVVLLGPDVLETGLPMSGATSRYPLSDIAMMEVMRGRHRPILRFATIGLLAGGTAGAILGAMTYTSHDLFSGNRSDAALVAAFVVGVAGAAVGGVQGSRPRDRWQRVNVDGNVVRFNMRALPRSGTGIGLALAF